MAMAKLRIDEDGGSQQKPNLNDVDIKILRVKEYKTYLLEKQLTVPYVQNFWENKFEKPELNWRLIWSTFRTCTNEPRITSLIWKI